MSLGKDRPPLCDHSPSFFISTFGVLIRLPVLPLCPCVCIPTRVNATAHSTTSTMSFDFLNVFKQVATTTVCARSSNIVLPSNFTLELHVEVEHPGRSMYQDFSMLFDPTQLPRAYWGPDIAGAVPFSIEQYEGKQIQVPIVLFRGSQIRMTAIDVATQTELWKASVDLGDHVTAEIPIRCPFNVLRHGETECRLQTVEMELQHVSEEVMRFFGTEHVRALRKFALVADKETFQKVPVSAPVSSPVSSSSPSPLAKLDVTP